MTTVRVSSAVITRHQRPAHKQQRQAQNQSLNYRNQSLETRRKLRRPSVRTKQRLPVTIRGLNHLKRLRALSPVTYQVTLRSTLM